MYYDHDKQYPVSPHYTWDVQDSTKVKAFMSCQRAYFYEYVLGWRREAPNNHLIFGSSWHLGLEVIHKSDEYTANKAMEAYDAFLADYRKTYAPDHDELFFPKTPERALEAFAHYVARHGGDEYKTVIHPEHGPLTEIAATVMVGAYLIYLRMDTLRKGPLGYQALEHKTLQSNWNWVDQWELDYQPNLYTHAMYCMFPPEEVHEVLIRGTFFTKNKGTRGGKIIDFIEAPVRKTPDQMDVWYQNFIWWLDMIKVNFEWLSQDKVDQKVMRSFPMNTTSCTKYFGCPYKDFCAFWDNPLRHADQPPIGFDIFRWDPSEKTASVEIDLTEVDA
jgi:hypothetical protein